MSQVRAVRLDGAGPAPSRQHKHVAGHEHEFEPVRGLPEALPAGEQMLWQGSPRWQALAVQAFHVRQLAWYFAALVVLRLVLMDSASPLAMLVAARWIALLGGAAIGGLSLVAWLSARGTVYTLTNRRIVMRVGIVLTLSFNIPLQRIAAAGLHLQADGSGDLPLTLSGADRIAFLHLWPHVRPWHLARPEPMLRAIPEAERVARLLTDAWSVCTGQPAVALSDDRAEAATSSQPNLATS